MNVRFLKTLICLILLGVCGGSSVHAQSAPINADPDFDGFYGTGDGNPGAWKPFKISNPGPTIWKHTTEGWPKGPSLWIYLDAKQFDGGVYQVIPVKAGRGYHFEVAWAVVRHSGNLVRDDVDFIRQVGIDPFGGTDPLSPNVQWSMEYRGTGKFPPELAVDQYARADKITLFIRAKNLYTDSRNEVFFDHAVLTENPGMPPIQIAPPTATLAPTATARPASPTIARTRTAAPSITPTFAPTATALPTNTAEPTVTRTPRATATLEPIAPEPASPDFPRLAIVLGAGIGLLGGGAILVLGAAIWLFKTRN